MKKRVAAKKYTARLFSIKMLDLDNQFVYFCFVDRFIFQTKLLLFLIKLMFTLLQNKSILLCCNP